MNESLLVLRKYHECHNKIKTMRPYKTDQIRVKTYKKY